MRRVALLPVAGLLLMGVNCPVADEGRGTTITFVNESGTKVWISAEGDPEVNDAVHNRRGRGDRASQPDGDEDCTATDLVARDAEGGEVDCGLPGLCDNDTWVIRS